MPAGIEELAGPAGCPNEPITGASGPRLLTVYFPEKLGDIPKVKDTDTAPAFPNSLDGLCVKWFNMQLMTCAGRYGWG